MRRTTGSPTSWCATASADFADSEAMQSAGRWDDAAEALVAGATALEAGGADPLPLCTNTMRKVADRVEQAVSIPFMHLADATAAAARRSG